MSNPASGVIDTTPSQVSAAQWQSFEMRMRKRRAARLLARAQAALEQGLVVEAAAALEEARTLDSNPEIEALFARTQAPAAPLDAAEPAAERAAEPEEAEEPVVAASPEPEMRAVPRFRAWIAVAASLMLVAVLAMWDVQTPSSNPASGAGIAATAPQPEGPTPLAAATSGRVDAPSVPPAAPLPAINSTPIDPAASYPPAATPASLTRREEIAAPAALVEPLHAEPVRELPVRDGVEISIPAAPAPAPAIVPASSDVNVPAPNVSAPVAPPQPTEPQQVDETPLVRRVLSQYEAAYSSLDVTAAKRVWPSLDTLALARAFGGLQMQRISLGDCRVSLNGPTAHADCRGSADWTPKIGGGTRSGNRAWAFDLRKTEGQWRIVDVTMR